jgi:hypothetical protein
MEFPNAVTTLNVCLGQASGVGVGAGPRRNERRVCSGPTCQ